MEMLREFIAFGSSNEWNEIIPIEAVNWLEGYVPMLAGVLSTDVLEKTREVIRNSLIEGSTLKERMSALRESSEELARMSDLRIEMIARTEVTRADSMGRLISMKANDDVIGVEFSAIMDDRTTEMCIARNGLVMRLDDPRLPENTPPLHVNCRSLLVSLTVYDFPDGVLTSHDFNEVPSGIQREEDIAEFRSLLEDVTETVKEGKPSAMDIRSRVEALIQQDAEYERRYEDLQSQIKAAFLRHDEEEYKRLLSERSEVQDLWGEVSLHLHEAKREATEQGFVFASGIARKLPQDDVQEIIQAVEGASSPIRKVWNIFEGNMKIAKTNSHSSYYLPDEQSVYINLYDLDSGGRPKYSVLFHELGHLIDDFGHGSMGAADLRKSLTSEVESYVSSTLDRLKSEAVLSGRNPKEIKKTDVYQVVEKEISTQLPYGAKMTVSDVFSGVTGNKVRDGWTHSTSYWRQDKNLVSSEFFAQTFSDSINNPEAIEITKRYFPESYKIFERIIKEIGDRRG